MSNKIAEQSVTPATVDEEFEKNDVLSKELIQTIRKYAEGRKLSHLLTDANICHFLHSCYYDIEKTKDCMETFYKTRLDSPDFFLDRNFENPDLKRQAAVLQYGVLPKKDKNGNQVILHRLHPDHTSPSEYVFSDGVKMLGMTTTACLYIEGSVPGYVFLFDMTGVRLGHLLRLNISALKRFFIFVQEGIPIRLKGIHVVNVFGLVDKIMFLIKPFMKKELYKMLHFHSGGYSGIHEALGKECLPSDFGGDSESIQELHDNFITWMDKLKDFFKEEQILFSSSEKNVTESAPITKESNKFSEPQVSLHDID